MGTWSQKTLRLCAAILQDFCNIQFPSRLKNKEREDRLGAFMCAKEKRAENHKERVQPTE